MNLVDGSENVVQTFRKNAKKLNFKQMSLPHQIRRFQKQ